jgi:hypothetical protein
MSSSILEAITSMPAPEKEIVRVYFDELVRALREFDKQHLIIPEVDESEFKHIILKIWDMGIIKLVKEDSGLLQWYIRDTEDREWILLPTFGR